MGKFGISAESEWSNLRRNLGQMSAVQEHEMKKAFFCGIAAGIKILETVGEEIDDEEQAIDVIIEVQNECANFILKASGQLN